MTKTLYWSWSSPGIELSTISKVYDEAIAQQAMKENTDSEDHKDDSKARRSTEEVMSAGITPKETRSTHR